jgi:SAM-dependent methyltransferase
MQNTKEDARCQVCDGANCPPLIEQDEWRFRRCADCGLVFLSPMLSDAELAELYSNPDSSGTRGYFHKEASKLRRARIRVRMLAGATAGGAKGRRFLDVGCSGGFMTQAAVAAGFITWGIDLDGEAVAHAKAHYPGATYRVSGLAEFAADFAARSEEPFDAVYCSEVLEHVADANAFVGAISGLMAPGGVLYLTTPDIGHWRRPRHLPSWDVFTPPRHCLFFSSGNLRQLLARHGLNIYRRQWAFKPGLKVFARKTSRLA